MWRRGLVCAVVLMLMVGALPPPTTAAAPNERWCPREVAPYCSENAFYDFWRENGGLEILGYPIDHPRRTSSGLIIQFYERAVMEWHPENTSRYQVLLARLAALYVEDDPRTRQAPLPCSSYCTLFAETNHTLRDAFLKYWLNNGGLAVYGFPLTEQFQERNAEDGKIYTVQYFERNRFEYHPENAGTRYEVLQGRLGAELLAVPTLGRDIRSLPTVSTPNYFSVRDEPGPPSPVAFVSPDSGPAGTRFTFDVRNVPAGATIDWIISPDVATPTRGPLLLNPTQKNFTVILDTEDFPVGAYTITFFANGQQVFIPLTFTVTRQ